MSRPQRAGRPGKLNSAAVQGSNSRSSGGFGGRVNYSIEQSCGLYTALTHSLCFPFHSFSLTHTHARSTLDLFLWFWQNYYGGTRKSARSLIYSMHTHTHTHTWVGPSRGLDQGAATNIASGIAINLQTSWPHQESSNLLNYCFQTQWENVNQWDLIIACIERIPPGVIYMLHHSVFSSRETRGANQGSAAFPFRLTHTHTHSWNNEMRTHDECWLCCYITAHAL